MANHHNSSWSLWGPMSSWTGHVLALRSSIHRWTGHQCASWLTLNSTGLPSACRTCSYRLMWLQAGARAFFWRHLTRERPYVAVSTLDSASDPYCWLHQCSSGRCSLTSSILHCGETTRTLKALIWRCQAHPTALPSRTLLRLSSIKVVQSKPIWPRATQSRPA